MANSINWGEVYKTSWWGDEEYNQHSILNGSEPEGLGFTGFLDEHAGAVVAYSTNRLSSLYSSTLFRVRRSSDDTEQDIGFDANGDLDTTALTTFVNAEHTIADEDFSSSTGWTLGTGVSITGGVLRANTSGSGILAYKNFGDTGAQQVRVTFTISNYVSGNVRYINLGTVTNGTSRSANGTYTEVLTLKEGGNFNHGFIFNASFVGDIDDFEIVQTTADGAVSIYEDQVNSTYNLETSDFSVGTNSYSSVSTNDSLTRLDDFEGVDNVLKLEATTGANSVHQMRKNIGQGDHFRYLVSCKIYIPTSNTGLTKVALYNGSDLYRVIDSSTEGDQWVTLENEEYFGSANSRFFVAGLNDAEDLSFASTTGDKFYLADVVIDGNYDLSNGTSDEQPLIVDGGTTETDNFFDFDGSNDRLVTKAIDAFQGDFTIDLEIDITDTTTRQAIFTNRTTTSDRFGLTIWNSNLYFDYYDGATYTGGRVASMTTGTYKITLTRASGVFTIYLNGTSQTISSLGGLLGSTQDNQMVLGDYRNVTNPTHPYGGRVRSCIVYDSAQPEAHATAFNSLFS